jgi:hypothetical protein
MKQQTYAVYLFIFLLLVVAISFFCAGVSNRSPISPDYNIPLAKSYLNGTILTVRSHDPYYYFPGSSNIFLAFFVLIGFPNLYGLLNWLVLLFVCKKLADTFGLTQYMSIIFAASFSTTISVVRTIGDQSIDKWLCLWFLLAVLLLEKVNKTWRNSLLLGLSLGMLIGTKYSGPLFFIALVLVYGKRLFTYFNPIRFIVSFLIFTVTGLFWYIRNTVLQGNPYYPANLPFLKGAPHFTAQDVLLWKVLLVYPKVIPDLINAFLSEYMIWAFSGFVVIAFLMYHFRKKKPIDARIIRLSLLGLTTGIVALFLPITAPYKVPLFHTISDMRYIYSFIAVLMLAVFLIADHYKKNDLLAKIALLSALPLFSFIPYQPKIVLLCIVIFFIFSPKLFILFKKI